MRVTNRSVALAIAATLATGCIAITAEADLSFDEIRCRLGDALREQFGKGAFGDPQFWLQDVFPAYVIARGPEEKLYKIDYTMSDDAITYGEAQEVEVAYVPVSTAAEFDFAAEADASDPDGDFPIVIMRAGWASGSLNGQAAPHYYTPEFIEQIAAAAEAQTVPFGRRHPDQRGPDPTGANDPERVAGYIASRGCENGVALGSVRLFSAEAELRSKLSEARKAKKADLFQVSALHLTAWKPGVVEGKKCMVSDKLIKLYSVDLCQRGGAGGQFLAAAADFGNTITAAQVGAVKQQPGIAPNARANNPGGVIAAEGAKMKDFLLKLLNALKAKDPAAANAFQQRLAIATEADYDVIGVEIGNALAAAGVSAQVTAEAQAALDDLHRAQSRNRIESKLTDSKLPEPAKAEVRRHLETRLTAEAQIGDDAIDSEISSTRAAFASMMGGRVSSGVVGLDSMDKVKLAAESMLGVKASAGQGYKFKGLKDAYITITGDSEMRFESGRHMLVAEAIASDTFAEVMKDAMHKMLLQEYAERSGDGLDLLYVEGNATDFRDQNRSRVGGLADLPTVNEGQDYQELAYPSDEGVKYAVATKGGILTINRRTIMNDDLGLIQAFPKKLARASRNTLRTFITTRFTSNPNYGGDNVAMFHASHGNLGTTALSIASLKAAEIALGLQTDPDSGEVLELSLNWIMVPLALKSVAIEINKTDVAGNPFYLRFGANNERIIVNSRLDAIDANDWYYGTDKNDAPILEIGFLNGQKEPEIFLANDPRAGKAFSTDQIQYKGRFEFGGTFLDYRSSGKNAVA